MSKRFLQAWPGIFAALLVVAFLGVLQFWPASYWLDVRAVRVDSGPDSAKLGIVVVREVKREFSATWTVTIRQWDGGWVVVCNAHGDSTFIPQAKFPKNLNLQWWTAGQCLPLATGKYQIKTVWKIDGLGLVPDKQVSVDSNVFEVTP